MNDLPRLAKRARPQSTTSNVPMWAVYSLPGAKKVQVDISELAGVPQFAKRAILDSDLQRQRAVTSRRSRELDAALLRRLAQVAHPGRSEHTDPLLWLLRVRWAVRAAAFPLLDVQCVSASPSTGSSSYRAMAAWACATLRIQPRDYRLCRRLLNEGEWGDRLSNPEACHWLLWAGSSGGLLREEAWDLAISSGVYPDRRSEISVGHMVSPTVQEAVSLPWRFADGSSLDAEGEAPRAHPPAWRFVGTRLDLIGSTGRAHPTPGGDS